jgi:hypothetical protein
MGTEVLITKGSPLGGQFSPTCSPVSKSFTLRDLFVSASISGNSLAAELGHYVNVDETPFSSFADENSQSLEPIEESDIHEKSVVAILEVIASNSNAAFEHVRAPEPQGGVQEWWGRKLSGTINNSISSSHCPAIGESL